MTWYSWARVKQEKVPRGLWTVPLFSPVVTNTLAQGVKSVQGGSSILESNSENRWRLVYMGWSLSSPPSQLITENELWSMSSSFECCFSLKADQNPGSGFVESGSCPRYLVPVVPHSTFPELTRGPVSHLYTHCLGEQPMPPMSSCAKTAKHLRSTALPKGTSSVLWIPSEPER